MHLLSRPRRPRRAGEWTPAAAVTFIVTLAASRSVTLAARAAGSRKSTFALKSRDCAFAAAWAAALAAGAAVLRQGDKVQQVHAPLVSPGQGDSAERRRGAPMAGTFGGAGSRAREGPLRLLRFEALQVSLCGDTSPHFFGACVFYTPIED